MEHLGRLYKFTPGCTVYNSQLNTELDEFVKKINEVVDATNTHVETGKRRHKGRPCIIITGYKQNGKDVPIKFKATFHCWGTEVLPAYDENSVFSVGICEDEDGNMHTPVPHNIKFLDTKEENQ